MEPIHMPVIITGDDLSIISDLYTNGFDSAIDDIGTHTAATSVVLCLQALIQLA